MAIRDAEPEDTGQICAMIEEHARYEGNEELALDRAQMRDHLFGTSPKAWVLISEVDGEIAGFAFCSWSFSTWQAQPGIWLDDLFIRPLFRRHGLGGELLGELRKRTSGRVEWDVQDGNVKADAFYRQLGAEPVHGWTRYRWRP